jgi:hypothetical protein
MVAGVAGFEDGAELCRLFVWDALAVAAVVVVVGRAFVLIAALVMRR